MRGPPTTTHPESSTPPETEGLGTLLAREPPDCCWGWDGLHLPLAGHYVEPIHPGHSLMGGMGKPS